MADLAPLDEDITLQQLDLDPTHLSGCAEKRLSYCESLGAPC